MSGKVVRIEDWRTPREPVRAPLSRGELVTLLREVLVSTSLPGATPERVARLFPEDAA